MLVSTRCLFPDFTITWLLLSDKMKSLPTNFFPKLTTELIKEYDLENGVENSLSSFLLEVEGKKALFDTGLNEKEGPGLPDRLKELKIFLSFALILKGILVQVIIYLLFIFSRSYHD